MALTQTTLQFSEVATQAAINAAWAGNWRDTVSLVESGEVAIDAVDERGNTLLALATQNARIPLMGWLIDHGADVTIANNLGWQPIHHAAKIAFPSAMELLLAAGAPVDAETKNGNQALHFAAWVSRNTVKLLLEAGAPTDVKDRDGRTALGISRISNNSAMESIIRNHLESPTLDNDPNTPLTKATLLAQDDKGRTLLDHPSTWQRWSEVEARLGHAGEYLELGDLLKTNAEGKSWLARAAECRAFAPVLQSLNAGGESVGRVELVDEHGTATPLMRTLVAKGVIGSVFSTRNWQDSLNDLQLCYQALPDNGRAQIGNWHGLQTWVSRNVNIAGRDGAQWGRGRGG